FDYVLKYGQFHKPQQLPSQYKIGDPGCCFGNAAFLALTSELRYAEGFAFSGKLGVDMPIHHGWCLNEAGRVVDRTWGNGLAYFGVVFEAKYVTQLLDDDFTSMTVMAYVWKESGGKLPPPPAAGPGKPVPIAGIRKAIRKTLFARIGVLPNGP